MTLQWLGLLLLVASPALAHDPVTTRLTWSAEISRIFERRCIGCHQVGGPAPFPLTTYSEARPWAVAIRDETLSRAMPPWNAVKGFGEFQDELSLTQEELQLIADWVNGGAPEGDTRLLSGALPPTLPPASTGDALSLPLRKGRPFRSPAQLTGIRLRSLPKGASARLSLLHPNGETLPLIWIRSHRPGAPDTYLFRQPLPVLPGSRIVIAPSSRPIPPGAVQLLMAPPSRSPVPPSPAHSHAPVAE